MVDLNSDYQSRPVISPDGSRLAYVDGGRLYVRHLATFDSVEMPDA